ncbi:MAG: V-type ATPase subunit [Clostridia bacterium]|nr:V-type ATPase subunit [Clostridia bacterium]
MAKNSLVYSNARVKALENTFLTNEKIVRMAYSDGLEEGIKVLLESSYGGGLVVEAKDYDEILQAEDKKVSEFVFDAMPDGQGMETFAVKSDYHNLKAIVKGKYMRLDDIDFMLAPKGKLAPNEIKDLIYADDYSTLSESMQKALLTIDSARADGNISPRFIDLTLDKACYADIMAMLKKAKNKFMTAYWQTNIDMMNISSFTRASKAGNIELFKESFIDGGKLDKSFFNGELQGVLDKLAYSPYPQIAESLKVGDMVAFERIWDNTLINIFKEGRNDIFTVAPIAGFYVAKKIEIKIVRMICILLKNDVDKDVIRDRLRELYA